MNLTLPKIYPITDTVLSGLSHAEQVRRMIKGGANFIQLRDKTAPAKIFYQSAVEVMKIIRKTDVKIIINDRVDIALALQADGVHLGQDDLPPAEARKILGEKAIIGFSTHNLRQVVEAVGLPINYIAVGPVFATKTKENPDEIIGLKEVKTLRKMLGNFPLVAIGGINLGNFQAVLSAGADSVAIISDIVSEGVSLGEKLRKYHIE